MHPHQLPPAPGWPVHPSLITTCEAIPGYRIARVIMPVMSAATGTADVALQQIAQAALARGANAIIGLRFAPYIAPSQYNAVLVLAYGTAVFVDYA